MSEQLVLRDLFMNPGFVCLPAGVSRLAAVTGSGVVFTVYDKRRRKGGMGYYVRPYRRNGQSTPLFAAPAIVSLVRMFLDTGSRTSDLEARLFGAAVNRQSPKFEFGLAEANIRTGLELFGRLGVPVAGQDVGGVRGRKIVFHSGTGEAFIARVERIRESDWYPA